MPSMRRARLRVRLALHMGINSLRTSLRKEIDAHGFENENAS
jgi:hypothetical protein